MWTFFKKVPDPEPPTISGDMTAVISTIPYTRTISVRPLSSRRRDQGYLSVLSLECRPTVRLYNKPFSTTYHNSEMCSMRKSRCVYCCPPRASEHTNRHFACKYNITVSLEAFHLLQSEINQLLICGYYSFLQCCY